MSMPGKETHVKQNDTNKPFLKPCLKKSVFEPVLDNLRLTKQERDLLSFLLPSSPASFPERRVKRFNSRKESSQTQFTHQARIAKKKTLAHSPPSSTTSETTPTVDSPPRAFGVLMDIADIDQAWKVWAGTS